MTPRAFAGLIVFAVLLLALGWIVLAALGVARSRREVVRACGLALFLGWATTGIVVSVELMLGLRVTAWEAVAGDAVVALVALAIGRRVPTRVVQEHVERSSLVARGAQLVVGIFLTGMLVDSLYPRGLGNSESWSQWLVKAKVIYFFGLDTGIGGYTQQQNGTYPPLDSALESTTWHFAGKPDILLLPFFHWIVFASFIGGAAYLLRTRLRAELVWPSLAMLVLAPKLTSFVGSSLGEELVAEFLGIAAIAAGLWLFDDDRRWLVVAGVCLAAASLTKNEGLVMSIILALLFIVAARRWWGLVLAGFIVGVEVPWKIWQHVRHVPPTFAYDWSRYWHPDRLFSRFDYLTYGARGLTENIFSPSQWLLVVPVALVLAALVALRRRPLAIVGIGFPVLTFVAFEITYWAGKDICQWAPSQKCVGNWHDVEWLVGLSIDRLPLYFFMVGAALVPLLLAEAEDIWSRRSDAKAS